MKTSEAVAIRLNKLLGERGSSLYLLRKEMAIHRSTIRNIASAQNKSVNLDTILLISRGLGITASEFLNDPMFECLELD